MREGSITALRRFIIRRSIWQAGKTTPVTLRSSAAANTSSRAPPPRRRRTRAWQREKPSAIRGTRRGRKGSGPRHTESRNTQIAVKLAFPPTAPVVAVPGNPLCHTHCTVEGRLVADVRVSKPEPGNRPTTSRMSPVLHIRHSRN